MKPRSAECRTGRTPANLDELQAMRAAVWHQQGLVSFDPATILDPWVRQAVLNEAARQYGVRNPPQSGGNWVRTREEGRPATPVATMEQNMDCRPLKRVSESRGN